MAELLLLFCSLYYQIKLPDGWKFYLEQTDVWKNSRILYLSAISFKQQILRSVLATECIHVHTRKQYILSPTGQYSFVEKIALKSR